MGDVRYELSIKSDKDPGLIVVRLLSNLILTQKCERSPAFSGHSADAR